MLTVAQPSGGSCTSPECGGGAMAGYLLGNLTQILAWSVLGVLALIKAAMLSSRN